MSYIVLDPGKAYTIENISDLFPLPCEAFHTQGIQDGMILRFKTFYLKIYGADALSSYEVQGYRYHDNVPVFVDIVPVNKIREYAAKFNKEDWLNRRR